MKINGNQWKPMKIMRFGWLTGDFLAREVGGARRAAERERPVYPPRGEELVHRARRGGEPS